MAIINKHAKTFYFASHASNIKSESNSTRSSTHKYRVVNNKYTSMSQKYHRKQWLYQICMRRKRQNIIWKKKNTHNRASPFLEFTTSHYMDQLFRFDKNYKKYVGINWWEITILSPIQPKKRIKFLFGARKCKKKFWVGNIWIIFLGRSGSRNHNLFFFWPNNFLFFYN